MVKINTAACLALRTPRLTIAFNSSLSLTRNLVLDVVAKNLLNTPPRYTDNRDARTQQIEYYDRTYEGGIRIRM